MPVIYPIVLKLAEDSRSFALATVIRTVGSTPQKAGAAALFEADGTVHGTLGGGCLEAEARQRALRALDGGQAFSFDLRLDAVEGWDDGLICGGRATILVNPRPGRNAAAYAAALQAVSEGKRGLLLTTVLHPEHACGTCRWLPEAALSSGESGFAGDVLLPFLESERTGLLRLPADGPGEWEVLVEPMVPAPRLIIAGAGHIGKALSHLGGLLEFDVIVVDDRPAFASGANLPDAAQVICGDIAEELGALALSEEDYVVIVTRGHQHDAAALAACMSTPLRYLGLIGSRRKGKLLREQLVAEGLATPEDVARVVSPIGLDLGGGSIQEIALSIAAQLVTVRRRGARNSAVLLSPGAAEREEL